MGPPRPWLVLALWPLALCGGTRPGGPEGEVLLPPTNVTIETYNFKTSLHWDYQDMSPKPLFTVEILCYGESTYRNVSSCVNISQHYCDLTFNIYTDGMIWARVKALVGSRESGYKESYFHLIRSVRIGPPKFNISLEEDNIIVDIEHPLTPYGRKYPLSVRANLSDFSYKVFYWEQENPQKHHTVEPEDQECDDRTCFVFLDVPLNTTYCVSVQGISVDYLVTGEHSNESCILLPSKPLGVIGPVIAVIASVVSVAVLTVALACWWAKRRNIPLPKSLAFMVRGIKSASSFDANADRKYSTVPSLIYKLECEDGRSTETIDDLSKAETSELSDSGKITESEAIPEATDEESCEGGQSPEASDTYFKSASGQDEMCTSLPNRDVPRADVQQLADPGARRNVSGYDKPHWMSSATSGEALIA